MKRYCNFCGEPMLPDAKECKQCGWDVSQNGPPTTDPGDRKARIGVAMGLAVAYGVLWFLVQGTPAPASAEAQKTPRYVPPPELIAEVAASSASYDLHVKMDLYQRQGVQEYIVWRVFEQEIDWFVLSKNKFKLLFPDSGGIFRSQIFPGLWLDAPALLRGDFATVMKVLKRGLRTKQHRDFVRKLQANR